jgi:hypothetical protein
MAVTMADGAYDARFACEKPDIEMVFEDALMVRQGQAKLAVEFDLADGTYEQCMLASGDKVLASFDTFAVRQGEDEDDDDDDDYREINEKRKEKRKSIVTKIRADDEHRKRLVANPASTGDYRPGWNYTLTANGMALPNGNNEDQAFDALVPSDISALEDAMVTIEMDMGVWKSNRALILLSILDGNVEVEDRTFTVELGYALYSVHHDVMRIGAFVSDDAGNIYKLKLRGSASGDDPAFPIESGDTVDLVFEGNSGPARNAFSGWHLELRGTIEAE